MKRKKGLIFACDLQERKKALSVTEKISDHIDAVKVNYPLILSCGLDIISELANYAPVISDFKVADIPHINGIISRKVFENDAYGLISHSFLGKKSLEACKKVAEEYDSKIFSVVEMSHRGAKEFIHPHYKELCALSKKVGVDGVIAPGNDLKRLSNVRKIIGEELDILSPGIGFQGGEANKALKAGADYIIVGRKIYKSNEPEKISKKLKDKICREKNEGS